MINRYIYETKEDWKTFRKGMFTASRINELMAKSTSDELSVGAMTYIYDLVSEMIAEPKLDYYSPAMEWGNETEPQAVLRYASEFNLDINSDDFIYTSVGGFVFFTEDDVCGGTPDIILSDKIVEIKCPDSKTHLYYLSEVNSDNIQKELPKYYDQMQLNMYFTNKHECDFVSYDPRFKQEHLQFHLVKVKRDEARIELIRKKIKLAHEKKTQLLNKLNK